MFIDSNGRSAKKDGFLWIHGPGLSDPWELYFILRVDNDYLVVINMASGSEAPIRISKNNWFMLNKNEMVKIIITKPDWLDTVRGCLRVGNKFYRRVTPDMIGGNIRPYFFYAAERLDNKSAVNVWGVEEDVARVCQSENKTSRLSSRDFIKG